MKRTATTIRCIPRLGLDSTQVRVIEVDLPEGWDDRDLQVILDGWFRQHGASEAVYSVEVDNDGYFAIINDDAFERTWGEEIV
jgi:hypothetical protein